MQRAAPPRHRPRRTPTPLRTGSRARADRYAAYSGTAPAEFSSGGRIVHRLSRRGTRTLNNALHMAAFVQLRRPGGESRAYFERRVAEGKTKKEAVRALKRSATPSTATS